MSEIEIIDELYNLLVDEHVADCDHDHCPINEAYDQEKTDFAILLYFKSGRCSQEFKDLFIKLPQSFRNKII
jgi:hypothetical protein